MATWDIRDVALVDGDATAMPFNDCVFDLIVSNLGINNFADPQAALAECARVARRGASIALATNLQGHMQEFYDVFAEVLRPFDHPLLLKELQAHIAHRTTVEAICAMLARAGLRVAQVHREAFTMRFLDGTALLGHAFIRVAFLDGWRSVVPPELAGQVFARLEERLNCLAAARGELALTIPLAYVAAVKQG
jgi:SAM-dependent methyltransferase